MTRRSTRRSHQRRGLTLLELVVVLTILAALGTVALTTTSGLANEARYQQTVRTLGQMQDAVIGRQPLPGEDPTAVPAGFVADVGRLPQLGAMRNLAELYGLEQAESALPSFRVRSAQGDSSLLIATGWRGPYVRRGVGSDEIRDGWGRAFTLRDTNGIQIDPATAPAATEIGAIISLRTGALDAFDVDLDDVVFREESSVDLSRGSVDIRVSVPSPGDPGELRASERVLIRLYGPEDGLPVVLAQWPDEGEPWDALNPTEIDDPIVFTDISIGPRYLRVYRWDAAAPFTAPGLDTDVAASVSQTVASSRVYRFTVQSGGTSLPNPLEVP